MGVLDSIAKSLAGHFLSPAFLWFLGLVPLVILLYLLKLRRTEIVIPSTMLWRTTLEDLTANAPFQRLRKNLLLFLQILVLLLAIAALARPFIVQEGAMGKNLCLIIDRSASMQTVESGKSRIELAKEAAIEIVNTMAGSDKIMVVAFGGKTDVLCEPTDDKVRLRNAIDGIAATDTRSNIRDVMLIARSLSPDDRDRPVAMADLKLILLSDGKISDLEELGTIALNTDYVKIGRSSFNAGIVSFTLRAPEEEQGRKQAFVLLHNEAETPLSTTVTLYLDDRVLGTCEIHAAPGSDGQAVLDVPAVEHGVLKAVLDHQDALGVDNMAWLVLRPPTRIKVLLVAKDTSTAAYFLKRAMALDPRVDLATVTPANYSRTSRYDLTIFESWSPDELPSGCLVFINTVPPVEGLLLEGKIKDPPVLGFDAEHVLSRFLNPTAVRIKEAVRLKLPEGARSLVSTTAGPLIADVSQVDRKIAVVAFDIAESNWPLHLSFPLFVQNLIAWAPAAGFSSETSIATGQPLTIMPIPELDHATVTLPDGTVRTVEMTPMRPAYFAGTDTAGVYRIRRGTEIIDHAVNLLDKNESSIAPASSLKIGRGEVAGQSAAIRQNRELWRWLVLCAIIVLSVEWWIFSRRAWI